MTTVWAALYTGCSGGALLMMNINWDCYYDYSSAISLWMRRWIDRDREGERRKYAPVLVITNSNRKWISERGCEGG